MTITPQEVLPVKPAHANLALPWYLRDLYKYLLTFAGMTVIYVGFRIYQGAFGVSAGLDSTEPAFATHWMRLLYIEAIFLAIVFPTLWGYLWFTRDRNLDAITPKEEITRYFTLTMWISIYTFAVYWAGSYFAEQDNSWHQVSIRDTPFTANHIIEFYFNFPFYVLMGGSAWLYARTRLPLYAKGNFGAADIGRRRSLHDLRQRRIQRMGTYFLVPGGIFRGADPLGIRHRRLVRARRRRYLAATSEPLDSIARPN